MIVLVCAWTEWERECVQHMCAVFVNEKDGVCYE